MLYPILIVEDDPKIAHIVKVYLEGAGFRVIHVDRGAQALEEARKEKPLLVVLDLMLPGLTGLDLLERLHRKGITTPFVLITGYASLDTAIEAVNRGAFSYIKKPFSIEEIRYVVNRIRQRQDLLEEIIQLKRQVEYLQSKLSKDVPDEFPSTALPPVMTALQGPNDMSKAFSAIEYLGRLKTVGLRTDREFGEY